MRLPPTDREILRDLARRYIDICAQPEQEERRELWRRHNSLVQTRPPVLCSWHWSSLTRYLTAPECRCEDPFLRRHELWLRNMLFHARLNDDHVFEPWITVRAAVCGPRPGQVSQDRPSDEVLEDFWGVHQEFIRDPEGIGFRWIPVIKSRSDLRLLMPTSHKVDEMETARRVEKLHETIGDILTLNVDRSSWYGLWGGSDLSTALGSLVGLEEFMMAMYTDPELIHRLVGYMRDAVMQNFAECEQVGDWTLANHQNMGEPYSLELPDPSSTGQSCRMRDLWFFNCAQEFTLVSPAQHWEFMLDYQLPIMEKFGLVSYGCCEDLTSKIDILRRIPNLRRIGVGPTADLRRMVAQVGRDFVLSWRPNPAMVACDFDPEGIRKNLRGGLEVSRGCNVEIFLKDISTIQGEPQRLVEWTRIAKEMAEAF